MNKKCSLTEFLNPSFIFPLKLHRFLHTVSIMYLSAHFTSAAPILRHFICANLFYIIITFHLLIELLRKIGSNLIYNLVCNQFDDIVHIIIFQC